MTFTYKPHVARAKPGSCGGPQRKDGLYIKQYHWYSSGQSIIYPNIDDGTDARKDGKTGVNIPREYAPAPRPRPARPDPTASWESPLPGVRCGGLKKGRLLKPGRLKAAGNVCDYESKKHVPTSNFICVRGKNFGRIPSPPPPVDPAPDEERVRTAAPQSSSRPQTMEAAASAMEAASATPREKGEIPQLHLVDDEGEEEEEENALLPKMEIGLHTSTMSLNLRITNLGSDFKRNKVMERLKLLEAEKTQQNSQDEMVLRKNVIRFSEESQMGIDADDDADDGADDGEETRSCSTCQGSMDLLTCSKPQNQRKSVNLWREKDQAVIAQAYEKIKSQIESPENISPPKSKSTSQDITGSNLHPNFQETDHSLNRHSDGSGRGTLAIADELPLQRSKQALNLSITHLDSQLKKQQVLERLKLLKAERADRGSQSTDDKNVMRFSDDPDGDYFEVRGDDEIQSCSTCEHEADFLSCSKPKNQRTSARLWRDKDGEEISKAYSDVAHQMEMGMEMDERSPSQSLGPVSARGSVNQKLASTSQNNSTADTGPLNERSRKALHPSKQFLNLSVGQGFKRDKIVERLRLLNAERRTQKWVEDDGHHLFREDDDDDDDDDEITQGIGSEDDDDDNEDNRVRDCDTCGADEEIRRSRRLWKL